MLPRVKPPAWQLFGNTHCPECTGQAVGALFLFVESKHRPSGARVAARLRRYDSTLREGQSMMATRYTKRRPNSGGRSQVFSAGTRIYLVRHRLRIFAVHGCAFGSKTIPSETSACTILSLSAADTSLRTSQNGPKALFINRRLISVG